MTHNDAETVAAAINALVVAQIAGALTAIGPRTPVGTPTPVSIAYNDLVITLERLEPPLLPPTGT